MIAKFRKSIPGYDIKRGDKLPIVDWSRESIKAPRLYTVYKNGHKIDVGRNEIKIINEAE